MTEKTKFCPQCRKDKIIDDFPKKNGKSYSWCKVCSSSKSKKYYQENKDSISQKTKIYHKLNRKKILERQRIYASQNKDKVSGWYRNRNHKLKKSFLDMYGGKCACCGESHPEFLTIDHINGQSGIRNKETGESAYRKAIRKYSPKDYRILCMNCNMATRFGRICPHQK